MAKNHTSPKPWIVTLNGSVEQWEEECCTAEEACAKVKERIKSLRDIRNFSARPAHPPAAQLSAPIPRIN